MDRSRIRLDGARGRDCVRGTFEVVEPVQAQARQAQPQRRASGLRLGSREAQPFGGGEVFFGSGLVAVEGERLGEELVGLGRVGREHDHVGGRRLGRLQVIVLHLQSGELAPQHGVVADLLGLCGEGQQHSSSELGLLRLAAQRLGSREEQPHDVDVVWVVRGQLQQQLAAAIGFTHTPGEPGGSDPRVVVAGGHAVGQEPPGVAPTFGSPSQDLGQTHSNLRGRVGDQSAHEAGLRREATQPGRLRGRRQQHPGLGLAQRQRVEPLSPEVEVQRLEVDVEVEACEDARVEASSRDAEGLLEAHLQHRGPRILRGQGAGAVGHGGGLLELAAALERGGELERQGPIRRGAGPVELLLEALHPALQRAGVLLQPVANTGHGALDANEHPAERLAVHSAAAQ